MKKHCLTIARARVHLTMLCLAMLAGPAAAQTDSARTSQPVKLTVGFAPGGPTDLIARELGKGLQEVSGRSVIVENKPGAASIIASEAVVRAAPDGSSLLLATDTPIVVLPFLREKMPYNPLTDLKPIALIGGIPLILVASPSFKGKTFAEFVAAAKASPGTINYASNGIGAGLHIAMERLQRATGISLNHIPYKGSGPALVDMFGGQVSVMWDTVPTSLQHIQSGKLIPLAIGSYERSTLLPNVPTMAELGYSGFDVSIWMGIMAPAGLSPAMTRKIESDVKTVVAGPAYRERMLARGFEVRFGSSDEFSKRIQTEYARNKALIGSLGVQKE
ncbi:MAG: transporter [Herminiimonas sp.]|nr:transporter [Herminiimonas sp.]